MAHTRYDISKESMTEKEFRRIWRNNIKALGDESPPLTLRDMQTLITAFKKTLDDAIHGHNRITFNKLGTFYPRFLQAQEIYNPTSGQKVGYGPTVKIGFSPKRESRVRAD